MKKKYLTRCFVIILFLICFLLFGCQKTTIDEEHSPALTDVKVETGNDKTEDSQYINLTLNFDKNIQLGKDALKNMHLTIAGERMEGVASKSGNTSMLIKIPVTAISKGNLEITEEKEGKGYSGITDESGKYTIHTFNLELIVPSGIALDDVSSYKGKGFKKKVEGSWNIRNITWLRLLENGTPVTSDIKTKSELLDDAVAVHGHDFLMSDSTMVAEKMVEALNKHFGSRYIFTQDGDCIVGEKIDGSVESDLDLEIYEYQKITQKTKKAKEEKANTGSKIKSVKKDREITKEEKKLLKGLHINQQEKMETYLYKTLTLTGDALGEMQVYAIKELEDLISLSYETTGLNKEDLVYNKDNILGLNLQKFLALCGVDESKAVYIKCTSGAGGDNKSQTFTLDEMKGAGIIFSKEGSPLTCCETEGVKGPIAMVYDGGMIQNVEKLTLSTNKDCKDPHYEMHNRAPHNETANLPFTIQVFNEGKEKPIKSVTFTTKELEDFAVQYKEARAEGYYGTIGNEESMDAMGIDGWLDYYSGINLWWLLTKQVGLKTDNGYAKFYGRDELLYTTVDNLYYLNSKKQDADSYYTMTKEQIKIPGSIPMIAFGKNGYPLLKEHEHESSGYHAYNKLNDALEALGVSCEIGVVKNQSGPFVAGLGNLDGLYGGYRVETGGDCIKIDIYIRGE